MRLRYVLAAMATLGFSVGSSASATEPYRLAFDASVTATDGGLEQFNLPFSLLLDEAVTGEISFESEAALQSILLSSAPQASIGELRL